MTGKAVEAIKDKISGIVVDAVRQVATRTNSGTYVVDEGDIKIKKQVGETMHDAELIRGVVIEKKRCLRADGAKLKSKTQRFALARPAAGESRRPR